MCITFFKKISFFFFVLSFIPAVALGQSCDRIFPEPFSSEDSHRQQTKSWMDQILGMSRLPDATVSESQSISFAFRLVRRKHLLQEEKNGVLSGDGLYFFTQSQSLDLTKPDSRLLDVRSNAWAMIDHDFASINRSTFTQGGGLLWSRGPSTDSVEDKLLLKQNDAFHIKWYNPNGTIKTTQSFSFPVQAALQVPSRSAWVIIPEKNMEYIQELSQNQKKKKALSEFFNQPILIYGQDANQKDFRLVLEDSMHLSSGDDFLSATPLWTIGSNFIVRAVSAPAETSATNLASRNSLPSPKNTLFENEIYIWSARNGKKLIHLSKNFFLQSRIVEPLLSVSISPDESFIACIFKHHLRFFHIPTESWRTTIPWDHLSTVGRWNPDGSIFLTQDTSHFLMASLDSQKNEDSDRHEDRQFLLQALPKKNYSHTGWSMHQPLQWLNHRVFVSHSDGNQKTIAVDAQTGNSLNHIFKNLPGLIFNNGDVAYRIIRPEGSTSYQLEVYQKVSLSPK